MPLHISLVQQFEQQQGETEALAFTRDGKQLLSADRTQIYHWQLNAESNWEYQGSSPSSIAYLGMYSDYTHSLQEGQAIITPLPEAKIIPLQSYSSHRWALSPDLRWIVSSESQPNILLWDRASQTSFALPIPFPLRTPYIDPSDCHIGRFLFTADARRIVLFADSPEGSLHMCSFDPGHQSLTLEKTFPHGMMDWAISPDSTMLALIVPNTSRVVEPGHITGPLIEEVYLYDVASFQVLHVFPQPEASLSYNLLVFSPDSHYLASSRTDGWIDIFSLTTFERIAQFPAHPDLFSDANSPIGSLAWSATGFIATGGASVFEKDMDKEDYSIKLWKVEEYSTLK